MNSVNNCIRYKTLLIQKTNKYINTIGLLIILKGYYKFEK